MSTRTRIEWTEMTWNPVTGCTKISQGCKNCYAERMARRLKAMGSERYRDGFRVTLHPDLLEVPRRWKQPRTVFVNSMSDLFHDDIPDAYIARVFETMRACPQHTFQVLTKRAERLAAGAAFFFKQWGGVRKDLTGRSLNGTVYDEMPDRAPVPSPIAA